MFEALFIRLITRIWITTQENQPLKNPSLKFPIVKPGFVYNGGMDKTHFRCNPSDSITATKSFTQDYKVCVRPAHRCQFSGRETNQPIVNNIFPKSE